MSDSLWQCIGVKGVAADAYCDRGGAPVRTRDAAP
jgi:hypothetical protein